MAARPNILYIHSHDTGRYIQPYGHAVPTPSLQRLAEQGVMFRQAFCAAPTCSPSRAALLTGQCAHSAGMLGLAHRGFVMPDYSKHLASFLRSAGYTTALAGVQHEAPDAAMIGYDRLLLKPADWAKTLEHNEAAVRFLQSPPEPFFLSVGFFETHEPFHAPTAAEDERFSPVPPPLPDVPAVRSDMACFRASARVLDQCYGTILSALERSGLADRTLVICTTDHGIPLPGMKCNLTDHGIGVYLVMRGPGGFAGGRVCDAMVSHVDVFPTICDLARIDPPPWLQGFSMMPLVRDQTQQIRDELYAEVTYHAAYEPQRCVRTLRHKYIRRFDGRTRRVLANCDDTASKVHMLSVGWSEQPIAEEMLFDVALDPQERDNLAARPEHAATLADMRRRLADWMTRTDDPLLRGPVTPPPGTKSNHPDDRSPKLPMTVFG